MAVTLSWSLPLQERRPWLRNRPSKLGNLSGHFRLEATIMTEPRNGHFGENSRLCKGRYLRKAAIPSEWLLPAQSGHDCPTPRAGSGHLLQVRGLIRGPRKRALVTRIGKA